MLARYRIHRGRRDPGDPLPAGRRLDIRKHRSHVLSPGAEMVTRFLAKPSETAFRAFETAYQELLERRFQSDRSPFDELANLASQQDVFLGCNCPTRKNPDIRKCHTYLALQFMQEKYPQLDVVLPAIA